MNEWAWIGLAEAVLFDILSLPFFLLKEKAVGLISGFNFKSKEEQAKYDCAKLSRDMGIMMLRCGNICVIGAACSIWWRSIPFWIAFVAYIIVLLSNVHWDDEKAFGKYRIEEPKK